MHPHTHRYQCRLRTLPPPYPDRRKRVLNRCRHHLHPVPRGVVASFLLSSPLLALSAGKCSRETACAVACKATTVDTSILTTSIERLAASTAALPLRRSKTCSGMWLPSTRVSSHHSRNRSQQINPVLKHRRPLALPDPTMCLARRRHLLRWFPHRMPVPLGDIPAVAAHIPPAPARHRGVEPQPLLLPPHALPGSRLPSHYLSPQLSTKAMPRRTCTMRWGLLALRRYSAGTAANSLPGGQHTQSMRGPVLFAARAPVPQSKAVTTMIA